MSGDSPRPLPSLARRIGKKIIPAQAGEGASCSGVRKEVAAV
jgi:hypothetical protein